MSVNCGRPVVFSGFVHQQNWPPRFNWNIVESDVKHPNPNPNSTPWRIIPNVSNSKYTHNYLYIIQTNLAGHCHFSDDWKFNISVKKSIGHLIAWHSSSFALEIPICLKINVMRMIPGWWSFTKLTKLTCFRPPQDDLV